MEHLSTSYIYAIQEISGETRAEKFKFIGQIVNKICAQENIDFHRDISENNVPNTLVPLIKVLVGVKIQNSAFIIDALKSDDIFLIYEALRARWFYDGSNKLITNYEFFLTNVLPFVSMKTRREIVKKLSVCLHGCTEISENFFNGFVTDYGVQEAINFLPNCRSQFVYDAIVKYQIVLSNKLLKKLYKSHVDVALKYLNFLNPYKKRRDEINRIMYRLIDINEYEMFIPLLISKHPEVFVTLQEISHTTSVLGKRRATIFLKNAKEILIQRPRDIIQLMPIKLVYNSLTQEEFEIMFGNILEDRWEMFNMDEMLNYLEYYPEDKRATLLRDKVKKKYNYDLFVDVEKITPKFLLLLPKQERHAIARRIVEVHHKMELTDPETSWWCFLPTQEAILALKTQISKNWKSNKHQIFSQLIYMCKLNESKEALLEVLRYIDENHENEQSDVICAMLDSVTQEFDINEFDQVYWERIFNIIKKIKLKKENARDYWVLVKILKKYVHYCDKHDLPANEIIDHIVLLFLEGRVGVSWMLLEDKAEYERRYLDVCLRNSYWLTMDYKKNVIEGIYNFNERHVTADNNTSKLSIKDYPHLLKIIESTLKKKQDVEDSWITYSKEMLKQHEPELFSSWFPGGDEKSLSFTFLNDDLTSYPDEIIHKSSIDKGEKTQKKVIYITEAIIALKRNYSVIKNDWLRYYDCCTKQNSASKKQLYVRQFLKSLRWYHGVPLKFVEKALQDKNYSIVGCLLDGVTFSRVARSLLPNEREKDHHDSYLNAIHVIAALKNTSTPISIELVQDHLSAQYMYSFKNYINDGLKLWSYVAYRTRSDRMIELAKYLSRERLFLKRHAIRVMNAMASRNDLVLFFEHIWDNEKHRMIRDLLTNKISKLFFKRPNDDTWRLVKKCIADLAVSDDQDLESLIGYKMVPNDYASDYVTLILDKLHSLIEDGMSNQRAAKLLDQLLDNIKPSDRDYLDKNVCQAIIKYYLDNIEMEFNNVDQFIVKIYLNPASEDLDARLDYFMGLLVANSRHWYTLKMEKRKNVPNVTENFVRAVMYQVQKFNGNQKLVLSLSRAFEKLFVPHQYAYCHIMLFLCAHYMKTSQSSFRTYGVTLSENVHALLERYTPDYFIRIVDLIRDFCSGFTFYEYNDSIKIRFDFIEGLIEKKNYHGLFIAARLLNQIFISERNAQYNKILQELWDSNDPIVQSFI